MSTSSSLRAHCIRCRPSWMVASSQRYCLCACSWSSNSLVNPETTENAAMEIPSKFECFGGNRSLRPNGLTTCRKPAIGLWPCSCTDSHKSASRHAQSGGNAHVKNPQGSCDPAVAQTILQWCKFSRCVRQSALLTTCHTSPMTTPPQTGHTLGASVYGLSASFGLK